MIAMQTLTLALLVIGGPVIALTFTAAAAIAPYLIHKSR